MTEWDEGEKRSRAYLKKQLRDSIEQRSKDREFHGVNREFLYLQARMIQDFEESRDIRHPRDVGNARENILRSFLTTGGYLPKKFGISDKSVRVVSKSGHLSNEIDILIYDYENAITLMKRNDAYEVYPIECVYGVIQVKSRLNKNELQRGLENLASFKKLSRQDASSSANEKGFALLFAYASDLKWMDIIQEIKKFAQTHPNSQWANCIFILTEGHFIHG